jgi:hypothetical protein
MAHFAEIENGVVVQVIVVSDDDAPDPYPESEAIGQAFIASLGLTGEWRQTSYNGTFRAHYAGIGYTYDAANDVFYAQQPYPSWTLDENWYWQPPTPMPDDTDYFYRWDEDTLSWAGTLKPKKPEVETLG